MSQSEPTEPQLDMSFELAFPNARGISTGLETRIHYEVLRHNPHDDPIPRVEACINIITGDTLGFD